jgi:TatD DNase family protein
MASDSHAHPKDLLAVFPEAETERRDLRIACAASTWSEEEFLFHETLAADAPQEAPLFLCFAVHPQLPSARKTQKIPAYKYEESLEFCKKLAAENRLAAIGETGFDLYSPEFKETESVQDDLFESHLEIARQYNLPLVLHVRKAMHKIFRHTKILKTLPAVVFHSWPGSPDEGFSLLRHGIRAFFSFGTTLLRNHKNAIHSCAAFPAESLLLETDAPYQPLPGKPFSSWADMAVILAAAADIRKNAGTNGGDPKELEQIIDSNFFNIFRQS